MKVPVSAPLIGPWLYRRSVRELADHAGKGDIAAVCRLAGILCTSPEAAVCEIARTALSSLTSVPAIDTLCREALVRDNTVLHSIITNSKFLPSDTGTQALFLFVTGQREQYFQLDHMPHHPLLASGYALATDRVRSYTHSKARLSGQCPVLAAALMGTDKNRNPTLWSEEEWESVVTGLVQERQWVTLWRLVVHAPLNLAITALSAMDAGGWKPYGDERALWEELILTMPRRWTSPVPENRISLPPGCPDSQPLRLAFSGDETLLAAACADGTICLWNTRTGAMVFRVLSGQSTIHGLALSPDSTHLISTGTESTLQCRDTLTGTLLWSIVSDETKPVHFACSRIGFAVVPRSSGGCLHIVSMAEGKIQTLSGGHEAIVTGCVLSHDDRICAVGYADGAVGLWDLQRVHYLRTLEGLGDPVSSLSFCENDDECFVIYNKNRPTRWQISSGERIRTYIGTSGPLRCCAITLDASMFAIADKDGMLRFWQAEKTAPVAEVPLYNRSLTSCAVSADGRMLAAGCIDGTLRTYAMNGGKLLNENKAHKQAVTSIALSQTAERMASAGWDGTVKLWDSSSGELVRTLLQPAGGVTGITATPDGSAVYAGYADGTVRKVPCGTADSSRTFDLYTNTVRTIAISPDGTLLACAGGDTTLRIWNAGTGGLVTGIEGLTTTQHCLTFSPDGKTLISGGWDGKVRLWSIQDGSLQKTLTGHTSVIIAVAISPDGTLLATGSNDRSVRLWTMDDGECIFERADSRSEVSALAMSPDGTLLAFAGSDTIIHLSHLPDGTPAPSIPVLPGKITALAFTGAGRMLVSGFDTGTVAVYSVTGRNLLLTVMSHTAEITGIAVLDGGESVLTSSLDGQVRHVNMPWTRPLSGTTLDDIPLVARHVRTSLRPDNQAQWVFLYGMLTTRFRDNIELSTAVNDERLYDIQIVG